MELFGGRVVIKVGNEPTENQRRKEFEDQPSFVPPTESDGSLNIYSNTYYLSGLQNYDASAIEDNEIIKKYRQTSASEDVDEAVEIICNEAVIEDSDEKNPVEIVLDNVEEIPEAVKDKISDEFMKVLDLLRFRRYGSDIFRQWFIDSRIFFHKVVSEKDPKKGIQELRWIDPTLIKKVREIKKEPDGSGVDVIKDIQEYYIFNNKQIEYNVASPIMNDPAYAAKAIKIPVDSIAYAPSGLLDSSRTKIIGYLNKAIKLANLVRMMEDAVVIYRLSRAPERRIFNVDVGDMPTSKAERYVKGLMNDYRQQVTYDSITGELGDERRATAMIEDFWFPKREGKGTEIDTLPGGQNLGEIEDVLFFKKNLYRSLHIPVSRIESDTPFNIGRTSEITRDEVTFSKFINKLRTRFAVLFDDVLGTQLVLKNICTKEEWEEWKDRIRYDFQKDVLFQELKNLDLWRERLNLLSDVDQHEGKYFSKPFIMENILNLTEEEQKQMKKEMEQDRAEEEALQDEEGEDDEPSASDFELSISPKKIDNEE